MCATSHMWQGTSFHSQLASSTIKVPGINSGHQIWWQCLYLLSHHACPINCYYFFMLGTLKVLAPTCFETYIILCFSILVSHRTSKRILLSICHIKPIDQYLPFCYSSLLFPDSSHDYSQLSR